MKLLQHFVAQPKQDGLEEGDDIFPFRGNFASVAPVPVSSASPPSAIPLDYVAVDDRLGTLDRLHTTSRGVAGFEEESESTTWPPTVQADLWGGKEDVIFIGYSENTAFGGGGNDDEGNTPLGLRPTYIDILGVLNASIVIVNDPEDPDWTVNDVVFNYTDLEDDFLGRGIYGILDQSTRTSYFPPLIPPPFLSEGWNAWQQLLGSISNRNNAFAFCMHFHKDKIGNDYIVDIYSNEFAVQRVSLAASPEPDAPTSVPCSNIRILDYPLTACAVWTTSDTLPDIQNFFDAVIAKWEVNPYEIDDGRSGYNISSRSIKVGNSGINYGYIEGSFGEIDQVAVRRFPLREAKQYISGGNVVTEITIEGLALEEDFFTSVRIGKTLFTYGDWGTGNGVTESAPSRTWQWSFPAGSGQDLIDAAAVANSWVRLDFLEARAGRETPMLLPDSSSVISAGDNPWSNPDNALTEDDSFASCSPVKNEDGGEVKYLFDFSAVPDDATLTGLELTVDWQQTDATSVGTPTTLGMAWVEGDNSQAGQSKAFTPYDDRRTTSVVGGSPDNWGFDLSNVTDFTPATIKAAGFGIRFLASDLDPAGGQAVYRLYNVKAKAFYSVPSGITYEDSEIAQPIMREIVVPLATRL